MFEVINNFRLYDRVCIVSFLNKPSVEIGNLALPRAQMCRYHQNRSVLLVLWIWHDMILRAYGPEPLFIPGNANLDVSYLTRRE